MNEITSIDFSSRIEALLTIQALVPTAVESACEQVGTDGVRAFFDGYKDAPEISKQAA